MLALYFLNAVLLANYKFSSLFPNPRYKWQSSVPMLKSRLEIRKPFEECTQGDTIISRGGFGPSKRTKILSGTLVHYSLVWLQESMLSPGRIYVGGGEGARHGGPPLTYGKSVEPFLAGKIYCTFCEWHLKMNDEIQGTVAQKKSS